MWRAYELHRTQETRGSTWEVEADRMHMACLKADDRVIRLRTLARVLGGKA